jgi:hypothetical protein
MIQSPPSFIVRTEAQQAGWDHGFRLERGISGGWIGYGSTTAQGEVWVGAGGDKGPWLLALTHPGVIAEFGPPTAPAEIGRPAWVFGTTLELHRAIDRAYQLGLSLPDAPLQTFAAQTKGLPKSTDAERLVVQRIGQDIFRGALLQYWNGRCPLTGIEDPALLRASHIVAWVDCDDDAHRLDVHNGLLLSALWDAAFDRGLISFGDDGAVLVSGRLSSAARQALSVTTATALSGLTDKHRANLARHRQAFGPFATV